MVDCCRLLPNEFINQQPILLPTNEEIWTINQSQNLLLPDVKNMYLNSIQNYDQIHFAKNHLKNNSNFAIQKNIFHFNQNPNLVPQFNFLSNEEQFVDHTNYNNLHIDNIINDAKSTQNVNTHEFVMSDLNSTNINSKEIVLNKVPNSPSPEVTASKKPKISFSIDSIIGVK